MVGFWVYFESKRICNRSDVGCEKVSSPDFSSDVKVGVAFYHLRWGLERGPGGSKDVNLTDPPSGFSACV